MDGAVQRAPALAALSASVESAAAAVRGSGRLPEPRLAVGIQNLPVSGPDSWNVSSDMMTMRAVGLMQEVPNRAKRKADSALAQATSGRAQAELRLRTLQVRQAAAAAWLERFYIERRLTLLDDLTRENELLTQSARAQLANGQGSTADALAPQQARADLEDRRDEIASELSKAKAQLRRWVGGAADEELATQMPSLIIDSRHLREHVHEHPEVALFEPQAAVATAAVDQARAAGRTDWGVSVMYGRRAPQFGDMVSVQVTVGLPFLASGRVDADLESRLHARRQVGAEREAMLQEHVADLEGDLADYEAASRQLERMRDVHLPLAEQRAELQLVRYRAATGSLAEVLSSRRELIELSLKQLEIEAKRAGAAAKLLFIYSGDVS
ncbi:MAG: TolC family protein [Pseudomonadota bacterium]